MHCCRRALPRRARGVRAVNSLVLLRGPQVRVGERSFDVLDRLGGRRARAAATAFWTDPNEASLTKYEEVCIPLYTRTAPLGGFLERAVRNPAVRLVFFEPELRRLDLLRQLDRIKCPTLIVAGRR